MQSRVEEVTEAVTVVRLTAPTSDSELGADALWMAGASAVAEEAVEGGFVSLTADVTDIEAISRTPEVTSGRWRLEQSDHDEAADLDAWRAFATPEPAGERFLLVPSWLAGPAVHDAFRTGDHVQRERILIDPGRTFGSGSHPTTRLCIGALEQTVFPGSIVADLGCGSGVLSVVAARLGARRVVAVDTDDAAVAATVANAQRNEIGRAIDASTTPIDELVGPFDVVVANIGVRVLTTAALSIAALVGSGGHLVLAGILDDQVAETLKAYPDFTEVARRCEDGWTVLTLGLDR